MLAVALIYRFYLRQELAPRHYLFLGAVSGLVFGASEAQRYGLVNEVVDPDGLMPRARELAAQLLENSISSLIATKRLINGFIAAQLDRQIAQAIEDNARIRTTDDFREGVAYLLEKRKPRWSGK